MALTITDLIEVDGPARINIIVGDAHLRIRVDEDGDLIITKQNGAGLLILPSASNQIIIKNEVV